MSEEDDWDWEQVGDRIITATMKTGNKIWIAGHLKSVRKIYEKEAQAYECLPTHVDYAQEKSHADIAIIYLAGSMWIQRPPRGRSSGRPSLSY